MAFRPSSKKPSDIGRPSQTRGLGGPSRLKPSEADHARYRPTSTKPSRREFHSKEETEKPREPFIRFGWRRRRPGWAGRMIEAFDLAVAGLVFIMLWAGFVAYSHFEQDLPSLAALKGEYRPPGISYVLSADGRVIGEYAREYRIVVPYEAIPRQVVLAFVAAEDANYFQHPGVDLLGIFRAMVRNFEAGRIVQGGSTITQQVTRSFVLTRERTYLRKIREALLAYRLEKNLSKQEILFLYLNQIYLGDGAYGVEGAARIYFGKSVGDLTLAEAALIAGLTQAPSTYSPRHNPKAARVRQRYVLDQMVQAGFVSPVQAANALEEQIIFRQRPEWDRLVAPQFMEQVRREIEALIGMDRLMTEELRVYTTVDLDLQAKAHESLLEGLSELTMRQEGFTGPRSRLNEAETDRLIRRQEWEYAVRPLSPGRFADVVVLKADDESGRLMVRTGQYMGAIEKDELAWALKGGKRPGSVFAPGDLLLARAISMDEETRLWKFALMPTLEVQGALVCLDVSTGEVKAMIGGRDFGESQFNRAVQALRQSGSSFKPFVYSAALDFGFTPADVLWDEEIEYFDEGSGDVWKPQNYDRSYHGPTTLYMALVKSYNVVAVRLLEEVGIKRVIENAKKMGITSKLAPYLSLALGSSEVTLLDMTAAYNTFPNGGMSVKPRFIRRIEDRDGREIVRFPEQRNRALSPETAYIMLDMLRGVVQRGTGTRVAALKRPVAGKTGTTNDLADAWFMGFTPEYTTGVWVGHDQRKRLGNKESGGRAAAPIFLYFMQKALENKPVRDFEVPPGVVFADMDPETGWAADEYTMAPVTVCFKDTQIGPSYLSEYAAGDSYPTDYEPDMVDERPTINIEFRDGKFHLYEVPAYSMSGPGEPVGDALPPYEEDFEDPEAFADEPGFEEYPGSEDEPVLVEEYVDAEEEPITTMPRRDSDEYTGLIDPSVPAGRAPRDQDVYTIRTAPLRRPMPAP